MYFQDTFDGQKCEVYEMNHKEIATKFCSLDWMALFASNLVCLVGGYVCSKSDRIWNRDVLHRCENHGIFSSCQYTHDVVFGCMTHNSVS